MLNGFALSTGLLPTSVGPRIKPNDTAPSLQLHYRAFITTTGGSVPVPRIGTLTLGGTTPLGFSLGIETTGSHVPCKSLDQGHATFMPDAIWTVSRSPSRLIPGHPIVPGFDIIHFLSTRHQWFTRVRLLGPHLTRVSLPFPSTLTTRALYPRSLRRFETCSCKPVPRGPPSSLAQHRTPYRSLGCAFMAHIGPKTHINRSGDVSERWRTSGVQSRFRNLPRSTLRPTIISIRNVIFTAAKTSSSIAPSRLLSGVNSQHEDYKLRGFVGQPVFV